MKVALLADVHANLPALSAVLDHAAQQQVDTHWFVGDCIGYGAFPDQTVRLLERIGATCIAGNYDIKALKAPRKRKKWLAKKNPIKAQALIWAYDNLSTHARKWLQQLPATRRLLAGGKRVLMCHAAVTDQLMPLTQATDPMIWYQQAQAADAELVVFGHTHQPMVREAAGVTFINPGSVGRSEDGDPRSTYAVVQFNAGRVLVKFHRVEYDYHAAARAIWVSDQPNVFASMLLSGRTLDQVVDQQSEMEPGMTHPRPEDAKAPNSTPSQPACDDPIRQSVLALAHACQYEMEHAHQVTHLALRLFDDTASLHQRSSEDRQLLHYAALLHDIGWRDGQKAHHKKAMTYILQSTTLKLTEYQRQIVALIARYHRKALPSPEHPIYQTLTPDDRLRVDVLAGLLRLADGLDRTHRSCINDVSVTDNGNTLSLALHATSLPLAEINAANKKADLISLALQRSIHIDWQPTH